MFAMRSLPFVFAACAMTALPPALADTPREDSQPRPSTATRDAAPYINPGPQRGTADRVPYTGAPGRTRAVPGTTDREDVDPLFKRSDESRVVVPQGDGQPSNLGPGDAIGKTIPERTHSDRKFP